MDIEVLRRAPLFATLDDEAFRLLTDELTEVDLSRGASVFREGDQGDQLYFIVSGKVKLGRTSPDGRESLLAILGPGELFGEMALFDPSPRTATATAVSETRLAGLRNESLNSLLRTRPESRRSCCRPWPAVSAAPTTPCPTLSSRTFPAAWPRHSWTWQTASAAPPRTASW